MQLRQAQRQYSYRPPYLKDMNEKHDPNFVNTPPLHTGFADAEGPAPEDKHLARLVEQFRKGKITCQKATVAMFWIRPHTDYRPQLTDNFRDYIQAMRRFGHNYRKGPIPIVLYEHKGQLVMSTDYKTYWANREDELWTVPVLILGDFTEHDFCHGLGDPIAVDSLDLSVQHELMDSDTRRLALLLTGEPLRIETKAQREAINNKDFHDAMHEPVAYEPDWAKTMNKHGEDPNLVLTPALHTGHCFGPVPEDTRYAELITQAQAGVIDCQLASVSLAMIRPYSDYLPRITDELRTEFHGRYDTDERMSITVYEYEPGHFMLSGGADNYAIYTLYRQQMPIHASCIILGSYTKTWAVDAIDKPFKLTLSPQAGFDPEKTAATIGKKVYEIMCAKDMHLQELSRLTGISYMDLRKMTDDYHPIVPSIEQLERIARVLSVKPSDIMPF